MDFSKEDLHKILGRTEYAPYFGRIYDYADHYDGARVFVTGAKGSIGSDIVGKLKHLGAKIVVETDIEEMNVLDYRKVCGLIQWEQPDIIFHLAAAKHAPLGEEDPIETYRINTVGTQNIIDAVKEYSPETHIVFASTCKACNPETTYGASKLIAERMILNAGHSVARFYNVVETSGNVFEIWGATEEPDICTISMGCKRYFISIQEAGDFILGVPLLSEGRYTINPGELRLISHIFYDLYPGRKYQFLARRRGDRSIEPRIAVQEFISSTSLHPIERVNSYHD